MNSVRKAMIITLIVLGATSNNTIAQFVPSKWEVGVNVGTLVYQGDLSTSFTGYTKSLKPSVEIWISKSLDNYFSLRANLLRGAMGADESTYSNPVWRSHRNLKFSTSVTESSVEFVWDLYGKTYREGMRRLSPYFFAGVGFAILNIKRDWSRFDTSYFSSKSPAGIGLGVDSLHKAPSFVPVIPVGAGLRYMLATQIFLNAEFTYQITASDYIDGYKYTGDPGRNDHYYGLSLGISYRFGSKLSDCPKIAL